MPYEFLLDWSEPEVYNYDSTFHNGTRRTVTEKGYTFYMDEYDLDKSVYGKETHRLDLRVVSPKDGVDYLIDHFESYEDLERVLCYISGFIGSVS